MIRVMIAEDQPLARAGLVAVLESESDIEVVGTAADDRRALELARELSPDVACLDIRMPGRDGIAVARELCGPAADPVRFRAVRRVTLSLLDAPVPAVMDGEPWQVRGPAPSVAELVALSDRAATARAVTVPFFVVLVATMVVRIVWVFAAAGLLRLVGTRTWDWRTSTVVSWAGMRGVVTLAAASLLPEDAPERGVLVFTALVVTLGTLILQGFTLGTVARAYAPTSCAPWRIMPRHSRSLPG